MREILFRAKRIDNGNWAETDYCREQEQETENSYEE